MPAKTTQKKKKKATRQSNIDRENFVVRIRALRKEKGLSQKAVGEKIGVGHSCVANWENGHRFPNLREIQLLSRIYGVPVDYLCGFSDHKYDIKVPDYFSFDLTKINSKGIDMLHRLYKFMLQDDEYRAK